MKNPPKVFDYETQQMGVHIVSLVNFATERADYTAWISTERKTDTHVRVGCMQLKEGTEPMIHDYPQKKFAEKFGTEILETLKRNLNEKPKNPIHRPAKADALVGRSFSAH